jgi:LuxR family transcriptional regulator, maltose regulon positive regulatory protein
MGREALARGAWEDARAAFEASLARKETPEALEGLGTAAWWLDDAPTTFDARERAYRLYTDRGDRQGGARLAIVIAEDCLDFRGEPAVANGWRERARRLLEPLCDVPERGWLALWEGHFALLAENDPAVARLRAAEAAAVARALELLDLEMLSRALDGLALVSEGRVADGMARLDEATAAALAGEMRDLVAIGVSCCYLVSACERVRDFDRAAQWCLRVQEFCRRWRIRSLFAVCRTHYAAVLMWKGDWIEAEAELVAAAQELGAVRPAMQSEAAVRLAELRRRQGRFDEAEALLRAVEDHPLAVLVSAALALDRGNGTPAADLAERFLRGIAPQDRTERLAGLEVRARALQALGKASEAAAALDELRSTADAIGTRPIRATVRFVEGLLAGESGELDIARRSLEDAVDLFRSAKAPFETAQARLELAYVLDKLGRREPATLEGSRAFEALERLGAAHEARRALVLMKSLSEPPAQDSIGPAHALTPREREVLQFLASGSSNAAIAKQLGISEFTIKRHVANILAKLDLPSRAAAAAYAGKHGLV